LSIERLIESLDMPATELKRYLLAEIDEFLTEVDPVGQEEELGDVLFALAAITWAHAGRHLPWDRRSLEEKIKDRLRTHAALTRQPRKYHDDRIRELPVGVLHFSSSNFGDQWQRFDALRNGTVAEIAMLTEVPVGRRNTLTNHCIVTFSDTDAIEYDILEASETMAGGNAIRCRIPDFMYAEAKRTLRFSEFAEYLSLQVLAALDGLQIARRSVAHLHSWENGFLVESPEFVEFLRQHRTIFSPYLTIGRLRSLIEETGGDNWTMSSEELAAGWDYEKRLGLECERVVLESDRDRSFYATFLPQDKLDVRSFARERSASFSATPPDTGHLSFLAGGRPVREKGFAELCREFAGIRDWAAERDMEVSLAILCRERRREKGASYISLLEEIIAENEMEDVVSIEPKVPIERLRERVAGSSAVIVPSIYDPFSLMATYAIDERRPVFVSVHAGVSEGIRSREFVFDPQVPGDLLRAIDTWHRSHPDFVLETSFPSYEGLYLSEESS
jgi:hypothetical protein